MAEMCGNNMPKIPIPNCSLAMDAELLCVETSIEVKTPENSCVPKTIKNIVPICSSTYIKQEKICGWIR